MSRNFYAALMLILVAAVGRGDPPSYTNKPSVLLLDTLKIVEGDFTRESNGDYTQRINRETRTISASSVLFAGDSRVAVNEYLTKRASADAPVKGSDLGMTDYNPDALKVYPGRIQPIVTNLCGGCHGRPDCPGAFKLIAIAPGYADTAGATTNLRTVLKLIDRADPSGSEFIRRMTLKHGTQREPAITVPGHPALTRIELWAHWLTLPANSREPLSVPRRVAKVSPAAPRLGPGAVVPASAREPVVTDPHDPAAFNRAMHPRK